MTKSGFIATAMLLASTSLAAAGGSGVERRQDDQYRTIEQGRRNGNITWREGLKLRADQRRISALERRFLADDGRIDREERRILRAQQNEAEEAILDEKYDRRRRPRWLPRFGR